MFALLRYEPCILLSCLLTYTVDSVSNGERFSLVPVLNTRVRLHQTDYKSGLVVGVIFISFHHLDEVLRASPV